MDHYLVSDEVTRVHTAFHDVLCLKGSLSLTEEVLIP